MEKFEIKEIHLKLLQKAYVSWNDCEYGAPEINPKRPYGNSDVTNDILKIVGLPEPDNNWPDELYAFARQLHKETETALQIILVTQIFETGVYVKIDKYNSLSWKKSNQ